MLTVRAFAPAPRPRNNPIQPANLLAKLADTTAFKLDRWLVTLQLQDGGSTQVMMNNYFSIGYAEMRPFCSGRPFENGVPAADLTRPHGVLSLFLQYGGGGGHRLRHWPQAQPGTLLESPSEQSLVHVGRHQGLGGALVQESQ